VTAYLLDSQVVVWSAISPERLRAEVVNVLEGSATDLFVSAVTIAELHIKMALGKLALPGSPIELCELLGATELPLLWHHAARLASLPTHHRDPFDRLLICQALAEDLTFVSSDSQVAQYGELQLLRA
jgi:PIN domain nuclease of toxin-antitoxin system